MASPRKKPLNSYDAVVIGAGLGGLSCALDLACQGLTVAVFERHSRVGGYAHNFRRKGYTFDVSLHHLGGLRPGQLSHRVLSRFGVLDKLDLRRRSTLFTAQFPDLTVELANDPETAREQLGAMFPAQKEGLDRLFPHVAQLKHHVVDPWLEEDFPVPPAERLSVQYLESTFGDLLGQFVSDPALIAILGQLWFYIGLPPGRSTATFSTCVFGSSFCEGSYYVRGGGGALTKAMAARLEELGGAYFTSTQVTRIRVEDRIAVGVQLAGGRQVNAPRVISNANPYQTFSELVPPEAISAIYRHRLDQMLPSLSAFATYIGLDCPPAQLGIPPENYFHNHSVDLEDAYQRCLAGELEHTDWCLSNDIQADPAPHPPGGGIVSLVELTPVGDWLTLDKARYARQKEQAHARLMKKYCARFEGLADHAMVLEFGTPRTMHRYTQNHGGALYGLAQTVEQSNAGRLRNRTPIGGLFLTGAWTWAGGGYEGAMMSGIQTSVSVMSDETAARSAPGPAQAPAPTPEPLKAPDQRPPEDLPPPAQSESTMIHQVTVFGDDLDLHGRTSTSAYLRYMDRGRVESIETICEEGGDSSWLTEYMVNVYRIRADFPGDSGPGDRLEVRTNLSRTSTHRAAFYQRVLHAESGAMVADAEVEVLFLDASKTLAAVPDTIPSQAPDQPIADGVSLDRIPFSNFEHFRQHQPHRVYYEDTDAQGITYHVSYVRFCERAVFSLLPRQAQSHTRPAAAAPATVRHLDIRYLHASYLGDRLELQTGGRPNASGGMVLDQRLITGEEQQVVADVMLELEFSEEAADMPAALLRRCRVEAAKEAPPALETNGAQPQVQAQPKSKSKSKSKSKPKPKPKKTGIGAFLLRPENQELVQKNSWKHGRAQVVELGRRYFGRHPDEADLLAANLARVGLASGGDDLDRALRHLVLHYYEKIFVLVKGYEGYWIAKNRIDFGASLEPFEEARREGKAVFIGQSHFGATYFMGLALMVHGLDLNSVCSFPGKVGEMMQKNSDLISRKYNTGKMNLLNLADPERDVPVEMMRRLAGGEIVSNVYDEANAFCRPMKLINATVRGGTGMDRILSPYSDEQIIVVTPFLIRTSEDSFRYELDRHLLADGDIIKSFYRSLESRILAYPHQWYFAQEVHNSFILPGE